MDSLQNGSEGFETSSIPTIDPATNPISAAKFESVDELFSKDPQFLTEENLAAIVEVLRAGRGKWLASEKSKGSSKTAKPKLTSEQAKNLLDNLVIDI